MKSTTAAIATLLSCGAALALPQPENVPELLRTDAGAAVASVRDWEQTRRPELLRTFLEKVYGVRPVEKPEGLSFKTVEESPAYGGIGVRKVIRISFRGPGGATNFTAIAVLPNCARQKPVPAFLLGCNRDPKANLDPNSPVEFWDAPGLCKRGYAAVAFYLSDISPDYSDLPGYWKRGKDGAIDKDGLYRNRWNREGVFAVLQGPGFRRDGKSWGTISAWAWAMSRVMDWIETEPLIDAKHVGVVGHSRGGKTALLAGILDTRFAMVCSNDSGCTGAKLNHISLPASEHIADITQMFPWWFCGDYDQWRGREMEMPFDQHEFLALVAPRLLAVASASKDAWAGPPGEFAAARLASPAWELYGKKGLVADPEANAAPMVFQTGCISYHLRPGKHNLTSFDWNRYMDFADRHGWRK